MLPFHLHALISCLSCLFPAFPPHLNFFSLLPHLYSTFPNPSSITSQLFSTSSQLFPTSSTLPPNCFPPLLHPHSSTLFQRFPPFSQLFLFTPNIISPLSNLSNCSCWKFEKCGNELGEVEKSWKEVVIRSGEYFGKTDENWERGWETCMSLRGKLIN